MSDYITLASSDGGINKRFMVESMDRAHKRAEVNEELSGGRLNIAKGRQHLHFNYTVFLPFTSTDTDYGSLSDLQRLWRLNNPNGRPSDVLTLTHVDGTQYEVRSLGDLEDRAFGVQVDGEGAYYTVQIELVDVTRRRFDLSNPAGSMFLPLI